MNDSNLNLFEALIGSVCRIFTSHAQMKEFEPYFVVRLAKVDDDGVWGFDVNDDQCPSFFSWNHVSSIHQEKRIVKKSSSEQDSFASVSKTIETNNELEFEDSDEPKAAFVDIAALEEMASFSQKSHQAKTFFSKNVKS